MFGFKLINKRELALYAAQIAEFRENIKELKEQILHERQRAEGAINALLIRTQKLAITPQFPAMSEEDEEKLKAKLLNIFDDQPDEGKFIERLQADAKY